MTPDELLAFLTDRDQFLFCNPLQKPDQTTTYKEQTKMVANSSEDTGLREGPAIPKPENLVPEDWGKEPKLDPTLGGPGGRGYAMEADPVEDAHDRLSLAIKHHLTAQAEALKLRLVMVKADGWLTDCEGKVRHARDMLMSAIVDRERKKMGIDKSEPEERVVDVAKALLAPGHGRPRIG